MGNLLLNKEWRTDPVNWKKIIDLMDGDIREWVFRERAPCGREEFLTAYEERHFEEYGTEFFID